MTKRPVELVATVYGAIKQKPHSPAPRRDGGLEPVSHHGSLAQDLVLEDLPDHRQRPARSLREKAFPKRSPTSGGSTHGVWAQPAEASAPSQ